MNTPDLSRFTDPSYDEPRDFDLEREQSEAKADEARDELWVRESLKKEETNDNRQNSVS